MDCYTLKNIKVENDEQPIAVLVPTEMRMTIFAEFS
jgi:hypothetical protein